MFFHRVGTLVFLLALGGAMPLQAQETLTREFPAVREAPSEALNVMRYSGVLPDNVGRGRPNVIGVTFSLYEEVAGTPSLWIETQNVQVDPQGHYSAQVGAATMGGVPAELFASGKARWLGIQVAGQAEERAPLGSAPYALQAADSQTLGGRSAAEYVRHDQVRQEVQNGLRDAGLNLDADGTVTGRAGTQSQPEGTGPPQPPGSNANPRAITNEDLSVKLDAILTILSEPETVFSWPLCAEISGNYEVAGSTEANVKLTAEGRLGAEGYGNGLMLRLLGTPEGKIETVWKFAVGLPKTGPCVDLAAVVRNIRARNAAQAAGLRMAAADSSLDINATLVDKLVNLDETALANRMLGIADNMQIDPTKLQNVFDRISNISFDGGPFAALRQTEDRGALMDAMPIPAGIKTVLANPASLIEKFKEIKDTGICNVSPRPAILDGPLDEICALVASEPFSRLLNRVDTAVENVEDIVDTIHTRIFATSGSCRFFCQN